MKCQTLALISLMALIMLVTLVSAEKTNETYICEYSYYFIIDHLQVGNILNYAEADLYTLNNSLFIERGIAFANVSHLQVYVDNYTKICKEETPDLVLPPIIIDVGVVNVTEPGNGFFCDSYINHSFLGFYDMDWSFPLPNIHRGQINCKVTQFFKWFLNYEKTGKYDYSITGFKLWWVFLALVIFLGVLYYKINKKINKVISEEMTREV